MVLKTDICYVLVNIIIPNEYQQETQDHIIHITEHSFVEQISLLLQVSGFRDFLQTKLLDTPH